VVKGLLELSTLEKIEEARPQIPLVCTSSRADTVNLAQWSSWSEQLEFGSLHPTDAEIVTVIQEFKHSEMPETQKSLRGSVET
jgi:hypothetical protein